ncbi:MAG: restriction endonuclease subunit S [Parcubacteria group bacterium]|jgi:type I restriction enzyme S subunit
MKIVETKFKETEIGIIPEEWDIVNINEALNIIDGDRGSNYPHGSDFSDKDYCLFLNAKNVCGDSFNFSNSQFISQSKDAELRKGKMQKGDFVLTTRGTVGNVAFYDETIPFENMRINSGMVILRNNKDFDSKYLFQLLKSWITKKQIVELTTGSAQPQLPIRDLKNLKIIRPTIEEQKQIAEIISSLDDKIELNRKINANLEKIASILFKKWFVDIGDRLLEEWKVAKFTDVVEVMSGGTPKTNAYQYWNGNIPFFTPKDADDSVYVLGTEKYITQDGLKSCNSPLYPIDTTFITARGTVGKVAMAGVPMAMNQSCYALRGKDDTDPYFVYELTKMTAEELKQKAHGSVFSTITISTFAQVSFPFPDLDLIKKYETTVSPLFEKIKKNGQENEELILIRDSLLPRLMSGKIRVKIKL